MTLLQEKVFSIPPLRPGMKEHSLLSRTSAWALETLHSIPGQVSGTVPPCYSPGEDRPAWTEELTLGLASTREPYASDLSL